MAQRAILTLQFGHYTNYIGSHFWNIQEQSFDYTESTESVKTECDHDILYRESLKSNGEVTYTPRVLLCDLKGSFKTLPCGGVLPDDCDNSCNVFCGKVEKIEESPAFKNKYLESVYRVGSSATATKQHTVECSESERINSWTDFLYSKLHPRSIHVVKEYCHCDDNAHSFNIFNAGKSIWNCYFGDEFTDSIRKYAEECDNIQGFHVNFDCTDGFSGLAVGCIEYLVDEYEKPILAHPIIASHYSDNSPTTKKERSISDVKDTVRLANILLSFEALAEHSSLFVPLCTGVKGWRKPGKARLFEYIHYNSKKYYHSSAILASALDTLSQEYRLMGGQSALSDTCAYMASYGRKMAAASINIPFTMNESEYLIDCLSKTTKLYTSITPSCKIPTAKIYQIITVRGISEARLKPPLEHANGQQNLPSYKSKNVKEMFENYFEANTFISATNVVVCENPLETKNPYPKYFSRLLNEYGFINGNHKKFVESCPVIAGYHNGSFLTDMIEKLHSAASKIQFTQLYKFEEEGLEASEYQEILNRLADFKDNYNDDDKDESDDNVDEDEDESNDDDDDDNDDHVL